MELFILTFNIARIKWNNIMEIIRNWIFYNWLLQIG